MRVAGEGDQIERVLRIETFERKLHRLFGFIERETVHRTRSVEHEDEFFRRHVGRSDALRRLQDEREETAAPVVVRKHRVFDLAPRNIVFQREIFIRDRRLILQTHLGTAFVRSRSRSRRVLASAVDPVSCSFCSALNKL